MSESYREQFPLLCDDLSDEERYSPHYHRQYRQMTYRSRTRSNVKGAVAILKRWPEHWSSFLTYWWIGVVMICLMTFILYNSLFAFTMLPTAHFKPIKSETPRLNAIQYTSQEVSEFPNVYMHIFTEDKKEIDLTKYLPHIEALASEYSSYNYHVVVVINDTSIDSPELSPEENNINALNSLWTKDVVTSIDKTEANNIMIEYIRLTKYLDNSPVSKYWRLLSSEIIEFLVRAVSIWDKSGITFNPIILTPQSPNSAYDKTLQNVFKSFGKSKLVDTLYRKYQRPSNQSHHKFKNKVNNIRDVINAMEHESDQNLSHNEILAEAESKIDGFVTPRVRRRSIIKTNQIFTNKLSKRDNHSNPVNINEHTQEKTKAFQTLSNHNDTSILPLFLDYLFHHSTINSQGKDDSSEETTGEEIKYISKEIKLKSDAISENRNNTNSIIKKSIIEDKKWLSPMIIPAKELDKHIKEIQNESSDKRYLSKTNNKEQDLTIDIKGNVLATKTACHAFLGTLFTDAIHCENKDKLTDFIVKELSMFCNGVLSSCSGIDIIIL